MKPVAAIWCAFFFLFVQTLDAQVPSVLWAKRYGGTFANDLDARVAVDGSGNSYVAGVFRGATLSFGSYTLTNDSSSASDLFLVKSDPDGNVVWAKRAGGRKAEEFWGMAVDSSGNIFLTGASSSSTIVFGPDTLKLPQSLLRMVLFKFDADGNALWVRQSVIHNNTSRGLSVGIDRAGNCYVAGEFASDTVWIGQDTLKNAGSTSGWDSYIAKYNPSGYESWAKSFGGVGTDICYALAVDSSGNSYVTGEFGGGTMYFGGTSLVSAGGMDIFLAEYNADGNLLWAKREGGASADRGRRICVDGSGNVYAAGIFQSSPLTFGTTALTPHSSNTDVYAVKYSPGGSVIWAVNAGNLNGVQLGDAAVDAGGKLYLSGDFATSSLTFSTYTLNSAGMQDAFIANYDSGGTVSWARRVGGASGDYGDGIAVDRSGSCYLTGLFYSTNIQLGGITLTNSGNGDIYVIKFAPSATAISYDNPGFPLLYSLDQNYPNPFNPSTTIRYGLPSSSHVTLSVFNTLGQRVAILAQGEKDAGYHEVKLDASGLSSGIYIYRLTAGSFVQSRKLMLLR